jgi:hypothetical protein
LQGEITTQKCPLQLLYPQRHTNVKKFVANKPQLCCQQMVGLLVTNTAFVGNKRPSKRRFDATKWRFNLLFFD